MKFATVAALVGSLPAISWAFPTGAGDCPAGEAAVSGSHLQQANDQFRTGSLEEASIEFAINGVPLVPGTPFDAPIGTPHTWSLDVKNRMVEPGDGGDRPFRGFLVRLEGEDVDSGSAFITEGSDRFVGDAQRCDSQVGGVTHKENSEKWEVIGEFMLEEASEGMTLDVTVVIENRDSRSAYFYTGYTLNAVDASAEDGAGDSETTEGGMMDTEETTEDGMAETMNTVAPSMGDTMEETMGESMGGSASSSAGEEMDSAVMAEEQP